jgi:uncharacterized protein YgiM (DUF1202 family)
MRTLILVVIVLGITIGLAGAQANRWVDRTKADVRAGRGSFYEVVDTVLRGEQVEVLRGEQQWLSIRTPRAKTGWIFERALVMQPVAPGTSDFLKLAPGDASTSATAASSGAKGAYAQSYARTRGFDYGAVTWIEETQPGSVDVEAFVRDGQLQAPGVTR